MAQKTPFESSAHAVGMLEDRNVADKIRSLDPEYQKMFALIATSSSNRGDIKISKKGMISKMVTFNTRAEAYTHSPPPDTVTVTAVSSLTFTFASLSTIFTYQIWQNTANNTVGVVDAIDTSGKTATMITIGDTTFSAEVGNVWKYLGNANPENSTSPQYTQTLDDVIYNTCQIFRYPVEISASKDTSRHVAGGDFFKRMKLNSAIQAYKNTEADFIWGTRSSSGNTTDLTQLTTSVATNRGLWDQAQNTFNFGNNISYSKFKREFAVAMGENVGAQKDIMMFTSDEGVGAILEMMDQANVRYGPGTDKQEYGFKTHTIVTQKGNVKLAPHQAFIGGSNANKAITFIPEELTYYFKNGRDLKPKKGIQPNDQDGYKDEILGEICLLDTSGGYTTTTATNLYSLT
jgi:hypothetical protein